MNISDDSKNIENHLKLIVDVWVKHPPELLHSGWTNPSQTGLRDAAYVTNKVIFFYCYVFQRKLVLPPNWNFWRQLLKVTWRKYGNGLHFVPIFPTPVVTSARQGSPLRHGSGWNVAGRNRIWIKIDSIKKKFCWLPNLHTNVMSLIAFRTQLDTNKNEIHLHYILNRFKFMLNKRNLPNKFNRRKLESWRT